MNDSWPSASKTNSCTNWPAELVTVTVSGQTVGPLGMGSRIDGITTDTTAAPVRETGEPLDFAVQGDGWFGVQTPQGARYTRNGHLTRAADGGLITADGAVVRGVDGPIKVGTGALTIDTDGSVASDGVVVGRLAIVQFADPGSLVRESGALLRSTEAPTPAVSPTLRTGSLEQSNVSVVDRVAELTSVNRSFQALQKAVSVLMNDVDGRAIETFGRR